jgi:hypothetical protein
MKIDRRQFWRAQAQAPGVMGTQATAQICRPAKNGETGFVAQSPIVTPCRIDHWGQTAPLAKWHRLPGGSKSCQTMKGLRANRAKPITASFAAAGMKRRTQQGVKKSSLSYRH